MLIFYVYGCYGLVYNFSFTNIDLYLFEFYVCSEAFYYF